METNDEADRACARRGWRLLFVITNIARRLNVEPEAALKLSNQVPPAIWIIESD
jgi:hypothetical protein